MVLYAMTHSKSFAAGIAGGPVADWRDYDSIYTERMMLMPQNNRDGYRKSSPRFDMANLHGNLLLVHGTTDDNVHTQNTIQTAYELQQLRKQFEMMLLPRAKHTVTQKNTLAFMQKTMLEFVKRQFTGSPFANSVGMSKQQPNQNYYKVGGRAQSDGVDRGEPLQDDKQQFSQIDKNAKHPAVLRSKKK